MRGLEAAGLDAGYQRHGLLNVYRDGKAFARAREELGRNGSRARALNGALPGGLPLTSDIAGAILDPDEAHCDPRRFVDAVGALAAEEGVDLRTGVEVLGLRRRGRRIESLWTTAGEVVADEVVVAAGVWSAELARSLGVRLPLEGGKGYHVDVEARPGDPELPVWLHESRVVITPMEGRLRLAGTLELTGTDRGGRRPARGGDRRCRAPSPAGVRVAAHARRLARPATVHAGRAAGHRARSKRRERDPRDRTRDVGSAAGTGDRPAGRVAGRRRRA